MQHKDSRWLEAPWISAMRFNHAIGLLARPTFRSTAFRPTPFRPTGFGPKLFVQSCFIQSYQIRLGQDWTKKLWTKTRWTKSRSAKNYRGFYQGRKLRMGIVNFTRQGYKSFHQFSLKKKFETNINQQVLLSTRPCAHFSSNGFWFNPFRPILLSQVRIGGKGLDEKLWTKNRWTKSKSTLEDSSIYNSWYHSFMLHRSCVLLKFVLLLRSCKHFVFVYQ